MKIPCFNLWLEERYKKGEIDWNPQEHEDWELPPFELFKEYCTLYPPDFNDGNFEVIPWKRIGGKENE